MIVNLHVTHDCNLACDYCYAAPKRTGRMSKDVALAAIELAEGADEDIHVVFFGGEPLLEKPLIREVVGACEQRAASHGHRYRFQLATNGLLADEGFIRYASEHGISIALSLDGDARAHDRHRRSRAGAPSWQRVVRRVPDLLRTNPYLHTQLVISPDTAGWLDESVQAIFALGIRFISTTPDYSGAWDRAALRRLGRAYRQLARQYADKTLRGERFFLSCFDTRIRTHIRGPCRPSERCRIGVGQISVAPSGRLYPCVQFVGDDRNPELAIGHVATGFDAAARQRLYRASEAEKPCCAGCALAGRCMNWCACVNWAGTGRLDAVSPLLCEHERLLMPIADELAASLHKKRSRGFIRKHYHAAFPVLSVVEELLASDPTEAASTDG